MDLVFDPSASRVTVRTGTTGLFSPLAHALELSVDGIEGQATWNGAGAWTVNVSAPVAGLRVRGAVRHGSVDDRAVSAADRAEIERRIRETALPVERIVVEGDSSRLRVRGLRGVQEFVPAARIEAGTTTVTASGTATLSLRALGIADVKGPLGAFRVADAVELSYRVVFTKK